MFLADSIAYFRRLAIQEIPNSVHEDFNGHMGIRQQSDMTRVSVIERMRVDIVTRVFCIHSQIYSGASSGKLFRFTSGFDRFGRSLTLFIRFFLYAIVTACTMRHHLQEVL